MKIISLLPSVTEILCELGLEDNIYGVTHECKYPPDAKSKLQIIDSNIYEIKKVRGAMQEVFSGWPRLPFCFT